MHTEMDDCILPYSWFPLPCYGKWWGVGGTNTILRADESSEGPHKVLEETLEKFEWSFHARTSLLECQRGHELKNHAAGH